MSTGKDFTLYVVGGMLYEYTGKLYIEDVKEVDLASRLPFWGHVVLISPVKRIAERAPSLVEFSSNSIRHYAVRADGPGPLMKFRLKRVLRSLLGDELGLYEFLAVGPFGDYGFKVSVRQGETKRIIAFEAPIITQKPGAYWRSQPTDVWKRLAAPLYFLHQSHFRTWAIKHAIAVRVVGEGILRELCVGPDCLSKVISEPLAVVPEAQMLTPGVFEEFWQSKAEKTSFTIMCADRLASEKGVLELVKAVDRRSARQGIEPDAVLHLYSSGPLKEEIMSYVRDRNLASVVKYHGRVSRYELIDSMRRCDLFANLTKSLDINRAMIDAASQGCAILASNLPGPRSFFKHGESAWLVDPTNPDEISLAVDYLLANFTERKNLARAALAVARTVSAEKVSERLMNWYMIRITELRNRNRVSAQD